MSHVWWRKDILVRSIESNFIVTANIMSNGMEPCSIATLSDDPFAGNWREIGLETTTHHKVAAIVLAGGQGT